MSDPPPGWPGGWAPGTRSSLRSVLGFSSLCVLFYYAVTNASAWTLSPTQRRWPRSLSAFGLIGCAILAFTLPRASVIAGVAVLYARDSLVASQESLLNIYRCRFNIDTQIVPGGCANGQPVEPDTDPIETNASTTIAVGTSHSCAIRTDNTITCWGLNNYGQTDAPRGLFADIAAGIGHSCAVKADGTIICWGPESPTDPPAGHFIALPPIAAEPAS